MAATAPPTDTVVNVLWIPAGLSCDGDSVALTGATQPAIEEIALGALPGLPNVVFHWPLIAYSVGEDFLKAFFAAGRGELDPFVLVVEGSIPNEKIAGSGYFSGFGNKPGTDQPMTFSDWIDLLAPKALAVLAAGTCATYGGIHAMAGNPTGAWGWPTISAGIGNRKPDFRSFACRAVRCNPITSRKPCFICCGRPTASRR